KNIEAFNEAVEKGEIKDVDKLPYIILMIDELADLMSLYKDDVQGTIKRLGAKARASGVHMLLSTQTPRREFIDGAIKANVPTKIVLMVANYTDSLVALGEPGAEELKPHGDFYASIGGGKIVRGQAPLIEDDEIAEIFEELREKYPAPELIDIDQAVVDAELRYKRMVAENTGKNPEDVTVENVGATTDSSKETIKSTRTEEEKEKAKKEHKEAMKKITEDEKSGNTGAKEVSIDVSAFSLKARNER
ncbi:FtsK/SpoIIIE domain-containing protein, partial [Staphylococcus aureus]|uniref:FtsK/SpoIIIE domain-containing protein n=1 Tax=Staphylococcus aureus TaxID=1280 RepID=UPI0037542FDF